MIKTELRQIFEQIYGQQPRIFRAPGRVNLIGEHTDYNEGFVLPFAIDRETLVAGAGRPGDTKINVHALDVEESFAFDLRDETSGRRGNWIDYVEGTARCLQKRFALTQGADLVFSSTVPIGAGLSSSAALEVSIGFALLALNDLGIDRKQLAFAAQQAEHEFVGVKSGIMDQFASTLGKKDHALLLDCRSLETEHIPLDWPEAVIIACDTRVKHELGASEYNTRRAECEKGVEILRGYLPQIKSLRDVKLEDLTAYADFLPETVRRRCRHVVTENARTLSAVEILRAGDAEQFGKLMFLSHNSLKNDYEVSCRELDLLVEIARSVKGVFGARMTGAGFGGCTVNLMRREALRQFQETVNREYESATGIQPNIYVFAASDGAGELE
jgi:galactokinase